jgi:hypothetical protein
MYRILAGAALVAMASGCAGAPKSAAGTQAASADEGTRIVCSYEVETGSNRKKKVCATEAVRSATEAAQNEDTSEKLDRASRGYGDRSGGDVLKNGYVGGP